MHDFGFKNQVKKYFKKLEIGKLNTFSSNELIEFIETCYSYAKISLNKYSSKYSKQMYSQPTFFIIVALKIYLNVTYREIADFIAFSDKLKRYLGIKQAPDYSTLQKFYKRMPTNMFERITNQLIKNLEIEPKIIALDESGFSSDYADKYYLKIRGYNVKHFTKSHIAIDIESRMILYS